MSREKINGSQIQNIKRWGAGELVVNLKNGDQLLLKAVPTDYGYDADILISKLDEKRV